MEHGRCDPRRNVRLAVGRLKQRLHQRSFKATGSGHWPLASPGAVSQAGFGITTLLLQMPDLGVYTDRTPDARYGVSKAASSVDTLNMTTGRGCCIPPVCPWTRIIIRPLQSTKKPTHSSNRQICENCISCGTIVV